MGLTKRKDGWYVEFRVVDDGKVLALARGTPGAKLKRWKTNTMNRTMAKKQEALIKTDLMMGKIRSEAVSGPMTFSHLAKIYLSSLSIQGQRTYQWKAREIEKRFIPEFGNKPLGQITPLMIEKFREKRKQERGYQNTNTKNATINRGLSLLKHIFSLAIREGWLERNPVSLVKFDRENNVRDRVLDPEEFDRLQQHSAPHLQAINLIAYQSGMRSGEILGLTWGHVDFKSGIIRLRAEDTKTDEARNIPMTSELTGLLRELYKVRYLQEDHVFLVNGRSIGSIKTAFKAACRRAKVKGFRFHDFRHTAVTNMRRAGIDHLTIMRITGHKTMEVFKRYNSFHDEDLANAARQFNTYLTLAHQTPTSGEHKLLKNQGTRP